MAKKKRMGLSVSEAAKTPFPVDEASKSKSAVFKGLAKKEGWKVKKLKLKDTTYEKCGQFEAMLRALHHMRAFYRRRYACLRPTYGYNRGDKDMGYTITIHPKSPALAQEMLAFCKKHLRPLAEVVGDPDLCDVRGPLPAPQLSYCKRRTHIGFDYGPGVAERDWCYRLLQWMAVKVGTRKGGLPCYLYDGRQWVVLDPTKYDDLGQDKSEYRRKLGLAQFFEVMGKPHRKMKTEIQRLDKLWEES